MKFFRKRKNQDEQASIIDPTKIEPQNAADFVKRSYAFHAHGEYDRAEKDIRRALELDESSSEAYYALGLNLKAQNRKEEAIEAFQKALDFIRQLKEEDQTRALMLSRITKGHINQLIKGHWDLRKEFWEAEK